LNYFQHHIGDYRRDTAHLSLLEHGVYRQLIDLYYLSEEPIPAETDWVIRRLSARTNEEIAAIHAVLKDFFIKDFEGRPGYSHKRCDIELYEYAAKAETARVNGKLGGRPKKTQPVISGNPDVTTSQANHEPLTINQEPEEEIAAGAASSAKLPPCPYNTLIDLSIEHAPSLPRTKKEFWGKKQKASMDVCWTFVLTKERSADGTRYATNHDEAVDFFARMFAYVEKSDFLSGRSGKWTHCDLAWLFTWENFRKINGGNYETKDKK
jgi:uncharacterized protein YdaU (DUF1376 family)